MLTYRTYNLAVVTVVLAASAIARLHRNDAEIPKPNVQIEQSHPGLGDTNAHGYLPDGFVEEERAARIEPMPPQF